MSKVPVNWSKYAQAYDLMASHNPAYQEIRQRAVIAFKKHKFTGGDLIVDIGGGTGNFSIDLANEMTECEILHLEPDCGMSTIASRKAEERGLRNWTLKLDSAENWLQTSPQFAGAISVHSLYTMKDPVEVIQRVSDKLKPGGIWFICDLGRELKIFDWALFLWNVNVQIHGVVKTIKLFSKGYPVLAANRSISRKQRKRGYWCHESAEFFDLLKRVGLTIKEQGNAYRGYSDVAICIKPENKPDDSTSEQLSN